MKDKVHFVPPTGHPENVKPNPLAMKPGDTLVILRPDEMRQIEAGWKARAEAAEAELKKLRGGLTKISAIRDSIVGFQSVGWSEHIYPLVAVLHDVGFDGVGYDEARKETRTLLDRAEASEALADRLAGATRDGLGMLEIFLMTQDSCPTEAVVAMLDMGPKVEEKLRYALNEWRKARGKDKA